jgi:hypothetical protein
MSTLPVTARTGHASQGFAEASGCPPGEKITLSKLPGGRIEMKAARSAGKISDVFGSLKKKNGPSLSIEEMNEIAARGWAGKR